MPTRVLAPLLLALVTVLAWGPATRGAGFAYDDREAIVDNPVVEGDLPARDAFLRDYWDHRQAAGHWRPAATLALRLDHPDAGPPDPVRFRRTNVVLHLLVVLLVHGVLRRLGLAPAEALAGAAVLAVQPALADSVAWISGRTSMLSALGGGLGLWVLAGRPRRAAVTGLAAALGLGLGLCGKEDALVFAPAYLLLALRTDAARARAGGSVRRHAHAAACALGVGLALGAWLALRAQALGAALPSAPHAPLAGASWPERLSVGARAWVELLRLCAWPLDVPAQLPVDGLPLASAGSAARAALAGAAGLAWLVAVGLGLRGALRSLPGDPAAGPLAGSDGAAPGASDPDAARVAWGALLASALALLPTAQLVPAGEVLAPRFLYLPLLLATPWLGRALGRAPVTLRVALLLVAVALVQPAAATYADAGTYWRSRARHEPGSSRVWNALGTVHATRGEADEARAAFARAIELDPRYSRPRVNLGLEQLRAGELEAAEATLDAARREGPANPLAHAAFGRLMLERRRPAEAAEAYRRARELAPRNALLWRGEGRAWLEAGRPERARPALARALALDPGDASTAALLARAGGATEAADGPR